MVKSSDCVGISLEKWEALAGRAGMTGSGASFPSREQQGRSRGVCQGHGYWCLSGAEMTGGQPSTFFYLEPRRFVELDASVIAAMAPCPPGALRSRRCWHPRSHLHPPWGAPTPTRGRARSLAPAKPAGTRWGRGESCTRQLCPASGRPSGPWRPWLSRFGGARAELGPWVRGSWRGNGHSCREKGTSLPRREGLWWVVEILQPREDQPLHGAARRGT